MVGKPEIPIGNGWELDEDNSICSKWNNVNLASDEVSELIFCTYPRKCFRDACPCVDNGLSCINACFQQECKNYVFRDSDIDEIKSHYISFDDEYY